MSQYLPLATLHIQHEFFGEQPTPHIAAVPDRGAFALAQSCGLVIKSAPGGVAIYADLAHADAFAMVANDVETPPFLWFRLVSSDDVIYKCSAITPSFQTNVFLFSNAAAHRATDDAMDAQRAGRLSAEEWVTKADLVAVDDERLVDVRSSAVEPKMVLGYVCLSLADLAPVDANTQPRRFSLKFTARETYWKYYLVGLVAPRDVHIGPVRSRSGAPQSGVGFIRREEALADGRNAIVYISEAPIGLRGRSDEHFELRDNESGRVLIERLPAASPHNLSRDGIGADAQYVSEIYMNI